MSRRVLIVGMVLLVMAAVAVGTNEVFAGKPPADKCPKPRPSCFCPDYYAPVICDGGCRYSNPCYASCAGATNCVGLGPGPVEY